MDGCRKRERRYGDGAKAWDADQHADEEDAGGRAAAAKKKAGEGAAAKPKKPRVVVF